MNSHDSLLKEKEPHGNAMFPLKVHDIITTANLNFWLSQEARLILA